MGDYTQMQVMIHDCPEEQVVALVDALIANGLRVDWDGPEPVRGELHIGCFYTNRSVPGDAPSDLADELIEAAPGATFIAWTDPAYEWLGTLVRYTPELGRHEAECTAEGAAVLGEWEILTALNVGGVGQLKRAVGTPWSEALTGRAQERTIRVPLPPEGS